MVDILELEKYRFNPHLEYSFCVEDLLDEALLEDFFEKLTSIIGAPSSKAAASIFMKRYAFVAVMSLYAMTVWNKKMNVTLCNINMEAPAPGKAWLPAFSFKDLALEEWEGAGDRAEWRDSVIENLFAKNIYPLIAQMEKNFGISKLILWENIAVYLFWLYETEIRDIENDDFRYLLFEAKGPLFGRYKLNPLQKYYSEKTEEVRIRNTCCFSYQLPAGKRCKTCPCSQIAKEGRCHDGENICSAVRRFA